MFQTESHVGEQVPGSVSSNLSVYLDESRKTEKPASAAQVPRHTMNLGKIPNSAMEQMVSNYIDIQLEQLQSRFTRLL